MKKIHPPYYKNAKISCACGAEYTVGSTKKEMRIETCSSCHPFYTGKQKLVDTARRIDRFKRMLEKKEKLTKKLKSKNKITK